MAYTTLKTTYKDDILDTDQNENIKYEVETNADDTISLTDVSVYSQSGDTFNAAVLNGIGTVVNAIGSDVTTAKSNITTIQGNVSTLQSDMTGVKNKTTHLTSKLKIKRGYFDPGAVPAHSKTESLYIWDNFTDDFASAPTVVASMYGLSADYQLGLVSLTVSDITVSGFTANIYNADSSTRHPWVSWIAIGVGA